MSSGDSEASSSSATNEVVVEEHLVGMEEIADFLASLRTNRWDKDKAQFENHDESQEYAVIPLNTSIGAFLAYTKACDELYHQGHKGAFAKSTLLEALEGVVNDHAHWVEGGYVFVVQWEQYQDSVLDRYLLEAYDPFGDDMSDEDREKKVQELHKYLETTIEPQNKQKISELLNLKDMDRDKTLLIPAKSEFALLTFSRLFLLDAISFKTNYNCMGNLQLETCSVAGFGIYYGNAEEFRSRIGKHLSAVLMNDETHLARLVENSTQIETSIVSLFLSARDCFPSEKLNILLPSVEQLIPSHRQNAIKVEEGEGGVPCYRVAHSTFDKIAKLYRLLAKTEKLEPELETIENALKEQRELQKIEIEFEAMIEEHDPISHIYRSIVLDK